MLPEAEGLASLFSEVWPVCHRLFSAVCRCPFSEYIRLTVSEAYRLSEVCLPSDRMLSEACRCGGLPAVCRFSEADLTADVKTEVSPLFCFRQALRLDLAGASVLVLSETGLAFFVCSLL